MNRMSMLVPALALGLALATAVPAPAGAASAVPELFEDPTYSGSTGDEPIAFGRVDAQAATYTEQSVVDAVVVAGAGYGHGVGMSQWGAHGQAASNPSTTYTDILDFYYGGSAAGTSLASYDAAVAGHRDLWVNLEYDRTDLLLEVLNTGSEMPGGGHAPATFAVASQPPIDLTSGQTARFVWHDENRCSVEFRNSTNLGETPFAEWTDVSCDVDVTWDGEAESPSTKIEIAGCSLKDWDAGVYRPCQYGRGAALHTIDNESPQRSPSGMDGAYNGFDLILEIDVDDYTLGISEVSYEWPAAALAAQAVAARSYGAAAIEDDVAPLERTCACDVYDTSRSQRYVGWGHIGRYVGGAYGQENWIEACEATDNEVLANPASPSGGIVSAVYSAANGGASENNEDIWGGSALPFLRSLPDPYDLLYNTSWTRTIPVDYFAARVGLDSVASVAIVATYESGSPSHVAVTGTKDGAVVTKDFKDTSSDKTKFMDLFAATSYAFPSPRILSITVPDADPPPPPPPPPTEVERLWGDDRYATAVQVSKDGYPSGAERVFIATGENFPDALAVAPLAQQLGGPLLLTRTGTLPAATAAEIKRLGASRITILGGTAAVSSSVATSLAAYGTVTRIWGSDRYATAVEISKAAFPGGANVAYVAVGTNFPDALAAAPVAAHAEGPLLLTQGDVLNGYARSELLRLKPDKILVVGGGASISTGVVNTLKSLAPTVVSVAAGDRYATAVAVSKQAFPGGASIVYVARGTAYPDALAGGPAAADAPGPIILVPETYLPSTVAAELVRLDPLRVVILGGPEAVSAAVESAIDGLFD